MAELTDGVVTLRAVEPQDLGLLRDWRNQSDVRCRVREHRLLNMLDQERWLERVTGRDTRDFMYVAETAVGIVGFCYWSPRDRTAEVSFIIGDKSARGKGYATRALTLLHDWGFGELDLARAWAECYANNEPGLKTLKRIGYTVEGRMREHVYRNGQRHDAWVLGLLKDEWLTRKAAQNV
jgi:RimJ/RimL family protein N-acetyltransferase